MTDARFDVSRVLEGRRILFVGTTGFIGKVALSMLLRRYPDIGKVFVLVRPGHGETSHERFFKSVASSPVFNPLREVRGDGFDAFLHEKIESIGGDVSKPLFNFTEADFERIGSLDAVVNCAGVVSFNPPLETALRINTYGVRNGLDVCRRTGASLVHVSTCFVAGDKDGEVWEDEPIFGFFPRQNELRTQDFSVDTEISDCERLIAQTKEHADDRQHVSQFREKAITRLLEDGRDPDDERTLRIATQRERKIWVAERLTELGMERGRHWGWPNTYVYTKSLGEQLCAAADDVRTCIVRPAIVESAVEYPEPGWNEGFTTTAPLAFVTIKGHRSYPSGEKTTLDIIPVDYVASGLIMATAATIAGENEAVYQLCSSDVNPFYMRRAVELLGLFKRRYFREREEGYPWLNRLLARMEPVAVTKEEFNARSAPMWKGLAERLKERLEELRPRWGAPRVMALLDRAQGKLDRWSNIAEQTDELFQLFMPFIHDREYIFRADHTRKLRQRMGPEDLAALPWAPELIDWRRWWLDVHMPGLEKWVFPNLEEEFKAKPRPLYTYRDLLEMFDTTTKLHRSRTALRMLPPPDSDEPGRRYTYADLQELAGNIAGGLRERGVEPGDRVMLLSENRPEWGLSYFGILKAGAVAVPVDRELGFDEVANLLRSSKAKVLVISEKQLERLSQQNHWLSTALADAGAAVEVARFEQLMSAEPIRENGAARGGRSGEMASLIFTSGTTGNPKGVMLSHRNFTSLLSRLGGVFDMDEHDGLLSVLPMHHTFEFTAGLLMPLMRGAQINYIQEVNADHLQVAFEKGNITTIVGVPALWQLLHRRINTQLSERAEWLPRVFDKLSDFNRKLREEGPVDLNLGKFLFYPIHKKFGGRIRLMISGGSALSTDTIEMFRGLGFNLYEGYGLTEAAPVLAVTRPGEKPVAGSVGEALPGIEIRIDQPDERGVGEVVASGPNVMLGYYEDQEATDEVLRDGWLHTGDLGRLDDEKRLFIVGRKKDVILGPSGENVYPDELEELYGDSELVKELSVVGIPVEGGGETVACMVVPEYDENEDLGRDEVITRVNEHFRTVSSRLPMAKRVKVLHFWDKELPRTATRKVKRKLVIDEIQRLERVRQRAIEPAAKGARGTAWIQDVLAEVTGAPRDKVRSGATLAELGFDSLMYAELAAALDTAGVHVPDGTDLTTIETVADVEKLVARFGGKPKQRVTRDEDEDDTTLPPPVVEIGRETLKWIQRVAYEKLLPTKVYGKNYLPRDRNFIVAANHSSHLDMGLVKHALGDWGPRLAALAARDYFFEGWRKRFFDNFTNVVPMERHGNIRESLRLAAQLLREGYVLLIFPEGTRARDGVMIDFKPSLGYIAFHNQADVLPMFLHGTHEALPVGNAVPKRSDISAHIGPLVTYEKMVELTRGMRGHDAHRVVTRYIEMVVRGLDPTGEAMRRLEEGEENQ